MAGSSKRTADKTKIVSYEEIEARIRTGDILVFHGGGVDGAAIEFGTGSEFSHCAMAIRPDPKKPPLIWQAGPKAIVRDPRLKTKHGGAQLGSMYEILRIWEAPKNDKSSSPIYPGFWRRLMVRRDGDFQGAAVKAIAEYEGRPFPSLLKMVENWIAGRIHVITPEKTLFCAELVALTYMRMGLLPLNQPANSYTPGSFGNPKPVDLLRGARLGPLVRVLQPKRRDVPQPATAPMSTD